jgi:hypothetical protein
MSGIKINCLGISNVLSVTFNTKVNSLNILKSKILERSLKTPTMTRAALLVNRLKLFAADFAAFPALRAARAPGTFLTLSNDTTRLFAAGVTAS